MATSEEITKKVLIEVELKSQELKGDVSILSNALDNLTNAQKVLEKQGQKNSLVYVENATQIRQLKQEIRDANKEIDNITKAVNAENGSLDQNRAVLAVINKTYASTGQGAEKLASDVKALTDRIKDQEKQAGSTGRNVGNYESALGGLTSQVGNSIPGFSKFSSLLQYASKGFDAIKGTSAGAAEGTELVAGSMSGLVVAGAAVIAMFAGIAKWFSELTPNAEKLQRGMSGVRASLSAFMSDLGKGVGFGELADDMSKAYTEAVKLAGAMQDLNRAIVQDMVDDARADEQIRELQLKMRNRRNTPQQEKKYFDEIQKIATDKYVGNKELADKQFKLVVMQATNARKFSDEERRAILETGMVIKDEVTGTTKMLQKGIETAAYLDKTKGLRNKEGAGSDLKLIAEAQMKQIAAENDYVAVKERAQNRLDAVQMKAEQEAEKDLAKQQEISAAIREINQEKAESILRAAQLQQNAFGRELTETDLHYQQLIFKQQQFIEKQKAIQADPKSSAKTKALAGQAIGAARQDIVQIQKEQDEALLKLATDYNRQQLDLVKQGALEILQAKDQEIDNVEQRQLKLLDDQTAIRQVAYQKEFEDLNDRITKTRRQMETAKGETLKALQLEYNEELELQGQVSDKSVQLTADTEKKKAEIIREAARARQAAQDAAEVLKHKNDHQDGSMSSEGYDAQKQQIEDNYKYEIETAQKAGQETILLEQEKQQALLDLKIKYNNEWLTKAKQYEQMAQNAAFSIIKNSLSHSSDVKQAQLEKDRNNELANTSLTSGQRLVIEEKYRKKEGEAKVKAFKNEQKISILQAIINGALAMTKVAAQTGVLSFAFDPIIAAQTALEIATIAAQKPPAYARGGIHYTSDGRGGVLPGYSKTDNTNAFLRSGEAVVVSEAMRDPWARQVVSTINQRYGGRPFDAVSTGNRFLPGFASGGVFAGAPYLPTYDNATKSMSALPINEFADIIGEKISGIKMPPVYVDVKDINHAQGVKSQTVDRVGV